MDENLLIMYLLQYHEYILDKLLACSNQQFCITALVEKSQCSYSEYNSLMVLLIRAVCILC